MKNKNGVFAVGVTLIFGDIRRTLERSCLFSIREPRYSELKYDPSFDSNARKRRKAANTNPNASASQRATKSNLQCDHRLVSPSPPLSPQVILRHARTPLQSAALSTFIFHKNLHNFSSCMTQMTLSNPQHAYETLISHLKHTQDAKRASETHETLLRWDAHISHMTTLAKPHPSHALQRISKLEVPSTENVGSALQPALVTKRSRKKMGCDGGRNEHTNANRDEFF